MRGVFGRLTKTRGVVDYMLAWFDHNWVGCDHFWAVWVEFWVASTKFGPVSASNSSGFEADQLRGGAIEKPVKRFNGMHSKYKEMH